MTLEEIKAAVDAGKTVNCYNSGYEVWKDSIGQYLLVFIPTGYCVGLTNRDGVTLNGKESDFFIA